MATMPGPRTHPTVKPLISANRRSLRDWEVKLGPIQTVVLLGVITGTMACSFYLGFFAGKKTGLEAALDSLVANAAKLPIEIDASDRNSDEDSDQIYAKLNTNSVIPSDSKKIAADILDGSSKANLVEGNNKNVLGFSSPKTAEVKKEDSPAIKILGEELDNSFKNKEESSPSKLFEDSTSKNVQADKTLGMVLEENKAAEKVAKQDKTQSANTALTITDLSKAAAKASEKKVENPVTKPKELEKNEANTVTNISKNIVEPKPETKKVEAKLVTPSAKSYVRNSIPKGWFAQVGAPTKLSDAETLSKNLASGGFAVMIENAQVRGQGYYRVLVGPEGSKEQSEILVKQLKREKYLKGEPFIRLIK